MQKDNVSAEEEMRKLQEDVMQKEREHLFLSDEVAKHKMAAEMAAELQGLQAGGERRCSNVSQTGDCCLEGMLQEVLALGTNGVETPVPKSPKSNGRFAGANARRRRRKKG